MTSESLTGSAAETRARNRGGVAVGHVGDLDPVEAGAVLYLRLWNSGPDAQARVWNEFARTLGAVQGRQALKALENIMRLCAHHARRPIVRHDLKCSCLGADEACFANFIAAAGRGDREDAMLIATLIVRADMAPSLTGLAESLGLALMRIAAFEGLTTEPDDPFHSMEMAAGARIH
ncbi:hypothetical protein [Phaeobacter sp. 22II1-1F12B]|uniref:hypothetical protein n=1 Tax=Phaeobacter sp. 22II1-1F12B TaxID=1317111 RepID=UPI000B524625|nr:hypothetical protein [Phaeobacter sp. 22II1-1F12B]